MNPVYLWDLLTYYKLKHEGLRQEPLSLEVPGTELGMYSDRNFCAVAVRAWNKLPKKIQTAKTVECFKMELKADLFELKLLIQ